MNDTAASEPVSAPPAPPPILPAPAVVPPGFTGSASVTHLVAALCAARDAFAPIGKSKTAKAATFSYDYADLAAVLNATTPALSEQGLYVMQPAKVGQGHVTIHTVLWHKSGEWLAPDPLSMPATTNDPQKVGSALSYGRRYAYCALLGIAAEDEDDDAASAHEDAGKRERPRGTRRPEPTPPPVEDETRDPNDTRKATPPMLKRLVDVLKEHRVDRKQFANYLHEQYGYKAWEDIERGKYDDIVALAQTFTTPTAP